MWTEATARRLRDESGAALVTAMLATIIIGGIALVLIAVAQTNLRATSGARNHQDALHTAEAGADLVVAAMNDDDDWTTDDVYDADETDRRQWAIDIASAARDATPVETGPNVIQRDGYYAYGIRPTCDNPCDLAGVLPGEPVDIVYGVGIVEGRTDEIRVVEYNFTDNPYKPGGSVVSEGDLLISSNVELAGDGGGVHTNGDLELSTNITIATTATASGECTGDDSAGCQESAPEVDIPEIYAADVYPDHVDYPGAWYDLCPDGTIREPSSAGPCDVANDVVDPLPDDVDDWEHDGNTWEATSNGAIEGIFYVHHGNVDITSNMDLHATILVSAIPDPTPDDGVPPDGGDSGNFHISSNIEWDGYMPTLTLIADRDAVLSSNIDTTGAFVTGEQLFWSSNVDAEASNGFGVIIIQDRLSTPGSPIHNAASPGDTESEISSNITIHYDGDAVLPVADGLRVGIWNEL